MTSREEILAKLAAERDTLRRLGVRRLALFGSYARNEARADSDIDLLVDLDLKTFDAYYDTKEFLQQLLGPRIDLVMRGALKPRLQPYVLQEAAYVEGL